MTHYVYCFNIVVPCVLPSKTLIGCGQLVGCITHHLRCIGHEHVFSVRVRVTVLGAELLSPWLLGALALVMQLRLRRRATYVTCGVQCSAVQCMSVFGDHSID